MARREIQTSPAAASGRGKDHQMRADDDIIIARIAKNGREQVRVALTEFKGHALVSIRVWFRNDYGQMKPGKSGIALRLDLIPDLVKALKDSDARNGELLGREAA